MIIKYSYFFQIKNKKLLKSQKMNTDIEEEGSSLMSISRPFVNSLSFENKTHLCDYCFSEFSKKLKYKIKKE
jgi:hypothetical protein